MGWRISKAFWPLVLSGALVSCESGEVMLEAPSIIDPPSSCAGQPFCYQSSDFPEEDDLDASNSSGLRFSPLTGAMVMLPANTPTDTDGDGVPDPADDCSGDGWRDFGVACDGFSWDDGEYFTMFYNPSEDPNLMYQQIGDLPNDLTSVDVYFLVDASSTMNGEVLELQAQMGNIINDLHSEFQDVQFGVGLYREYGLDPLAAQASQAPYHHILDITDDEDDMIAAINAINVVDNLTLEDAGSQAMYSVATGEGIGAFHANRFCDDPSRWGYPCFRADSLPIILNFTDDRMTNGPDPMGPAYGDPPFDGSVGASFPLPPVRILPVGAGDDGADAFDLGDMSTPATVMGVTTPLTNAVDSSSVPGCGDCGMMGCDDDYNDAVFKFNFSTVISGSAIAYAFGAAFPASMVSVFDSTAAPALDAMDAITCSDTDLVFGAPNWGMALFTIDDVTEYYAAVDGLIPAADPGHLPEGTFQLWVMDLGFSAYQGAWVTHNGPVTWAETETELINSNITVASVITPRLAAMPVSDGLQDALDMAVAIGSVDKFGNEYVETANADGTGIRGAISDLMNQISDNTRRDIAVEIRDNLATAEDERDFFTAVMNCPTTGPDDCDGVTGLQCDQCEPGAPVAVDVTFNNDFMSPTGSDEVFDTEVGILIDGVEIFTVPFRFLVPAAAATYTGSVGEYIQDDIDAANMFCTNPGERPDWGQFSWVGTYPSDTVIRFELYTANSLAELDTVTPSVILVPTWTTLTTWNWADQVFIPQGISNHRPYGRMRAELQPSSDGLSTPTLEGWDLEFECVPIF